MKRKRKFCRKESRTTHCKTVVRFLETISSRPIANDDFFTDITLTEELLQKKIFLVGTVRKNRKDLLK